MDHVRQTEQVRQLMEDAIITLAPMPVAAENNATKAKGLLLLRQAVLAQNRVITRQHLAASEGSVMAEKVFSQGMAIEGLDEEAAKAYKEAKKEKEKEAKARCWRHSRHRAEEAAFTEAVIEADTTTTMPTSHIKPHRYRLTEISMLRRREWLW